MKEEDCPDQNNDVYLDVSNLASAINKQRGTSGVMDNHYFSKIQKEESER